MRIPTASARLRPSTPSPRRGRSRTSSMSGPPPSTSSACTISSFRPAASALPDKERRFEAGLLDLRHRHGPLCRGPARRRDQPGRALPRQHHHPQPGARRHLHGRDLPGRSRPGARRRHARHRDQQIGVRALRRARRAAPLGFSTAWPPCCSRSSSAGRPPRSSAAASERGTVMPKPILTAFG